jgi:diaminopropionate ammonia-lyase
VLSPAHAALLGRDGPRQVRALLSLCPRHSITPLHQLSGLAQSLDLGAIFAKDEGHRLGLHSFKALGGAYAVARLVQRWAGDALGKPVAASELLSDAVREAVAGRTVACATDGNHGRSVAAGARIFGCNSVIFVHPHVSAERRAAMASFGANIIEVQGSYDDSVAECAHRAEALGWQVVSDTSWPGYEDVPGLVMQGYTVMVDEALAQMTEPPTHVFVQAGVGGMAAAVAAHLADLLGAAAPRLIVVEPHAANCLKQSAEAGEATTIRADRSTIMGMLECYRPSDMAWEILGSHAFAFMDLADETAPDMMKRLAFPPAGDPPIVSGESGGAGLAGLVAASADTETRQAVGLSASSRVLVFITEGATAPSAYHELVGTQAQAIRP